MPATFVVASDTFTRANQTGFGLSSDGEAWSEPVGSAALSIVSNRGQITGATGATVALLGKGTQGNVDLRVRFSLSAASSDVGGVVVRYLDANDYVRLEVSNGVLQFRKVVAGVSTILSPVTSVALSNSTNYQIHVSAYDANYLVNVWADGTNEPSGWMLNCFDVPTQITGQGQYGLYTSLGAGGDIALFDSFQALTIPQAVLTVGGKQVPFEEDTLKVTYKLDERMRMQVTTIDYNGPAVFSPFLFGEQVVLTDPTLGVLFQGFLLTSTQDKTKLYPSPAIEYQLDTVDNRHLLDKRRSQKLYTNTQSNLIIADLIQRYVSGEGVTGNFALLWKEQQSEWSNATNTSVTTTINAATVNEGAGDLELATTGGVASFQQSSQADFNAGTTGGGLSAQVGGGVTFTSTPAIKFTATEAVPGVSNAYVYIKIWDNSLGSYTIPSTFPTLTYDIWIADSCPQQMAAVEFVCTDGTSFFAEQSQLNPDTQGIGGAATNDLSGLATNQWYTRSLPLYGFTSLGGKSVRSVALAFAGTTQGNYTAYFRRIKIAQNDGTNALNVFSSSATAIAIQPQILQNNGYTNVLSTFVTSYERHGYMYSPSFSLTSAQIAQSSSLTWNVTLPSSSFTFEITASIDNGVTFLPCAINSAIPGLIPGMNMVGKNILLVYVFDNAGNDPTLTPFLSFVSGQVNSAYAATKSDSVSTTHTQAGWNAGTLTNLLATSNNLLMLNGYARNWDNADATNQTLYGAFSPAQGVTKKQFTLSCSSGSLADARSRLDFAGSNWQNFTVEVDISLPVANLESGIVYRTTGWQNANETYAYCAIITTTSVAFTHGTNTSSGAGSLTLISSATVSFATNQVYHFKVVVNGNLHQIYVNDVLYLSTTDATYPGAGYLGLRIANNTASTQTITFDNFGVVAALSGQWVSPAIDIHSLGTVENSQVILQIDPTVNVSLVTFLVEISLNNGSTWAACTNVASPTTILGQGYFQALPVPGLTSGTNVSGMTQVLLRVTITTASASTGFLASPYQGIAADVQAISLFVLGGYSSSGSHINAPLVWDSMLRIPVTSGWGNTSQVEAYSQVGTATTATTGSEATIANTTGDCHMVPVSPTGTDEEGTVRFQLSANTISAGIELRYTNASNYYRLAASTTSLAIVKNTGGGNTTLASSAVILLTSTNYHLRFRVTGAGPVTLLGRVWQDGTPEPTTWTVTASD